MSQDIDTSKNFCCSDDFSKSFMDAQRTSAKIIVSHILRLFPEITWVADFACGNGVFLHQFLLAGVDVMGFDSGYDGHENLVIPQEKFTRIEPGEVFTPPRKYDLAICLDLSGHFQGLEARSLFDALSAAADVIIFSAAVPENDDDSLEYAQWPSHWSRIFGEYGFECIDILRPLFWRDDRIGWKYRQNLLLFLRNEVVSRFPQLDGMPSFHAYPLIHPDLYACFQKEKHREIKSLHESLDRRAVAMAGMVMAIEKNASALEQLALLLPRERFMEPGRREKVLRTVRLIPGAGFCLRSSKKIALRVYGKVKDTRAWHSFKKVVNETPIAGSLARKSKRLLKRVIRP